MLSGTRSDTLFPHFGGVGGGARPRTTATTPVFRSRVTFSCQDPKVDKVTLTETPHALEIDVIRLADPQCGQSFASVCQRLLYAIDDCCNEVHSCMYGNARSSAFGQRLQPALEIKWEYALLCQSCSWLFHSPHYCYFTPGDSDLLCTKGTSQYHENQEYWVSTVS